MALINIEPSPVPRIVSNALPPKKSTVVRLTKTNSAIQNTARIVLRLVENRFSTN